MMLVASRQAAKQLAIQAAVAPSMRPLIRRVWRPVHCIVCQPLWPEQRPARCAGATMANGSRSAEAVAAYRKALELKPNYMRAWANMGISQANLGAYDASARYYIRALGLNPG
jgi:tetratricopeptide (TPR) repeat protein